MNKERKRKRKIKRKTTVSKFYENTEKEVIKLLQEKSSSSGKGNTNEKEIAFFTNETKEVNNEEHEEISQTETRSSPPNSPDLTNAYLLMKQTDLYYKLPSQKLNLEPNLLFLPALKTTIVSRDVEAQHFSKLEDIGIYTENFKKFNSYNMSQMLARYIAEESTQFIGSHCLKNQHDFCQNLSLYRTNCDRSFTPIYHLTSLLKNDSKITTEKRILTITLEKLTFLKHPLQTEEHRIAGKLEEICKTYFEKQSENCIQKIASELIVVRQIIIDLLKKTEEADIAKLDSYVNQVRILKKSLQREETIHKTLIKNALETWASLKQIRNNQGTNWTNIKLIIYSEEANLEGEDDIFNESNLELNEVLREEFDRKKEKRDGKILNSENENFNKIRNDLRKVLIKCSRIPKIRLHIEGMGAISENLKSEKEYFLSILLDGQLVLYTNHFALTNDFNVRIDKTFSVCLEKRLPECVTIGIYETRKLGPAVKLTELYLPIVNITSDASSFRESLDFCSKNLNIVGKLKLSLYCTNFENQSHIEHSSFVQKSKNKTEIDPQILKQWYENDLLNPQDPDCMSLVKQIDEQKEISALAEDNDLFILNEDLIVLCSADELKNNQRLRLLKLRYDNDMKYKHFKCIPLFENEFEEQSNEKVIEKGNWMDPIDIARREGKKRIRKLYNIIESHCICLNKTDNDPSKLLLFNDTHTFGSMISTIINFFVGSKTIIPPKITQPSLQPDHGLHFNIIIKVFRATGIPVRSFSTSSSRPTSDNSFASQATRYTNVSPYVCVAFKDKVVRTMSAEGSNPTWNEHLVLQIPENIDNFGENIKIQIFDEYTEELFDGESIKVTEFHQRIHSNWLGEVKIPLTTLLNRSYIDGVFELNTPKVLFGYTRPNLNTGDTELSAQNVPEIKDIVHLWLCITIEPQFEMEKLSTSNLECSELKEVKMVMNEWCAQVKEKHFHRFIDPLITLANGKKVCITRLLEPIPLPFENNSDAESLIRRYVSLIPVLQMIDNCAALNGIWLNNQIVLDGSWGSPKDLGVLLACFYLTLGIQVQLVLGIAHPHGESTFVLLKNYDGYYFVDPFTGKKYHTKDVYCPMTAAYYIISQVNVYCNLQNEKRVSMTEFDCSDSRNWLPMFGKKNPAPVGGIQKLNYNYKQEVNVVNLQKNVERKIMKKINLWRSMRKTIWNRIFYSVMHSILNDLEKDMQHDATPHGYIERLSEAFPNYKFFGFTLNFGYTNLSAISERIKSTGIYLNPDKNVEFSIAVLIHQYPSMILSVWIFLVTATPIQ